MTLKVLFNKEALWTFLAQATSLIGSLLLIKLLAVFFSSEEYGYYSLITSIIALVFVFPFGVFLQGVSRYFSIYTQKNAQKKFIFSVTLVFLIFALIYFIISLFLKTLELYSAKWDSLYFYIIFYTFSEIFKGLLTSISNADRQRKILALSYLFEYSIKLGFIYYGFIYTYMSLENALLALSIGNILVIFIVGYHNIELFSIYFIKSKQLRIYLSRIWIFSYPLLIWAIFTWLRDMSSRWYLNYFLDKENVALFSMMSSIALIAPTALQNFIGSFFIPILYQKERRQKGYTKQFLHTMLPLVAMIFLLAFVITYFYKNEIILLIADSKYLMVSWMLPWMFLVYSFYVLATLSIYELFASNRTKQLLISSIAPGIISIICGYFLIKHYGINGALINYIITYGSYSLFTFYVVFKYWRVENAKKNLISQTKSFS